jgi:hypothetical protein
VIQTYELDAGDGFTATIDQLLGVGDFEIGIIADNPADPEFSIAFITPVEGVPEPASLALAIAGLGMIAGVSRKRSTLNTTNPQEH